MTERVLVVVPTYNERVNVPLIVPAISPHAPYTCTPEILKATSEMAREFDVPLHTHLAETLYEVENMRRDQGMLAAPPRPPLWNIPRTIPVRLIAPS